MKVLAGVGSGAVALLFLLVGLFTIFRIVALYMPFLSQNVTATTGTVVGIRTWTESGDTYHSPDVRFTTEDGRPFTVNLWCPPFGCFAESGIGSQVPVVYQKNYPEVAIADTFAGRWLTPLLIIVVASVETLVGAARLVSAPLLTEIVRTPIISKGGSQRHLQTIGDASAFLRMGGMLRKPTGGSASWSNILSRTWLVESAF